MNDTEISGTIATLLLALGWFMKHHTPLPNNWIPSVLVAVAIVATMFATQGWTEFTVWVQALMAGFTAVGFHASARSTTWGVQDAMPDKPKIP